MKKAPTIFLALFLLLPYSKVSAALELFYTDNFSLQVNWVSSFNGGTVSYLNNTMTLTSSAIGTVGRKSTLPSTSFYPDSATIQFEFNSSSLGFQALLGTTTSRIQVLKETATQLRLAGEATLGANGAKFMTITPGVWHTMTIKYKKTAASTTATFFLDGGAGAFTQVVDLSLQALGYNFLLNAIDFRAINGEVLQVRNLQLWTIPIKTVVNATTFGLNPANTDLANGVAVAAMATYANSHPYTKIVVNNGIYRIKRNATQTIFFNAAKSIEIDGGGSTFILSDTDTPMSGSFFELDYCKNFTIRNLNIDWDWDTAPICAVGKITKVTTTGVVYEISNNIPINNSPKVLSGKEWDNTLKIRSGIGYALSFVDSTQWLDSKHVSVGISSAYRLAQAQVGLYTMLYFETNFAANAINLVYSNSTLLDNVTIYSAPMNSFYFSGCKDYTITNCNVISMPGTERYRTVVSGGEFHNSEGSIVYENNTISYTHDDGMHMSDGFIPPYMRNDSSNTKGVVADYLQQYATKYTLTVGDTLEFRNADFSPTGISAVLVSATWVTNLFPTSSIGQNRCNLVFDRDIPTLPAGAYLFNKRYGRENFRIANNTFTNNFCDGIVVCIPNGTIENNCISRTGYSGLRVYLTLRWGKWVMGTGPSNVTIKNNTMYECNNGDIQLQPACFYVGAGIDPNGSDYVSSKYRKAITNVTIIGNTVIGSDSQGFGLSSVTNAIVSNNTLIDVGRAPATTPLMAKGAIGVENSDSVKLSGNRIFQPIGTTRKGLVIDAKTTSNITSIGLIQQTQQKTVVALAATNILATSFIAHWKKSLGASTYLLSIYKKNYNLTADSLVKQYSVADTAYVVTGLTSSQAYSYKVAIQPAVCSAELLTLSNAINLSTLKQVSSSLNPNEYAEVKLYPTLCDKEINVLGISERTKYSIVDLLGNVIARANCALLEPISVSNLYSGAYFLQLELPEGVVIRRFVKK